MKTLKLPGYLTIAQAAVRMKLKQDTLRKYVRRDVIHGVKHGSAVLVPVEEVARFAAERRSPGRQPGYSPKSAKRRG
jgi:excisionase family DNA binding protein